LPSTLTIGAGFAFNEDQSNIPRASELDKTLPVSKPYWLNDSEPIEQKGKLIFIFLINSVLRMKKSRSTSRLVMNVRMS
jgi:hypothetical protein